ncbi:uncharacterized protein MELLADRAFT_102330 [Melampsora larici-populina 98AG31]|uniref:Methyltransferase n=1 Tax=Melampsora larici-populina (strain 98AG31 / pathotype 3-4-7) TaxID=747676 RepID=F4R7Y1_MELLP|nr:uncharacterized protein MELLADRAFT_102330 [Melampsora larici-populina 98AG31]EGG11398.1 hypothetical protein MELLADRAFT_102330 [Melampsora larici-populina 98AG31]
MEFGFEVLWQTPSDISYEEFGTIIGSDERFEVTKRYRTTTCDLLKTRLGADRVVAWNHHIRRSAVTPETEPDHPSSTLPATRAHVDQSDNRAREAISSELGFKTSEELQAWVSRGGRATMINLWRPLKGPVRYAPLTVCDGRSVRPTELVRCNDYFGEHFSVGYHESQRWYYISDQMPSEPILILCYDSAVDPVLNAKIDELHRASCCPHTAALSPENTDVTDTRESIEVRTYAFWDPPTR